MLNNTATDTDIISLQGQSLTDDLIASAERRITNVQKILELSLKITNENDWVDQNGKPYLQASGAEKVARLFSVSWENVRAEKIVSEDEKGKFYFYQVTMLFRMKSDSIIALGTCSSKDQFFAKSGGEFKPLSEIDETNIMKAAYTNCVTNGITRLLGIRNLTWDMVKSTGTISKDKVASVKYAGGGAGGGKISEAQGKRLWAILQAGSKTSEDRDWRAAELKKYLTAIYKIEHSVDIERKDYDAIVESAENIAKEANERQPKP